MSTSRVCLSLVGPIRAADSVVQVELSGGSVLIEGFKITNGAPGLAKG